MQPHITTRASEHDISRRTCDFLKHEVGNTYVTLSPCLSGLSSGVVADSGKISAAYGFHAAREVKHDGASPGLRVFAAGVFRGPKELLVLGGVSELMYGVGQFPTRRM